ncbi:hypothetical protein C7S14_8240 [Burkholderia cepacia]|nr:hypothetical protein C7S14_8240 [Burkholderia cepacia]
MIHSLVFQPCKRTGKQLAADADTMEPRCHKQGRDERRLGDDRQTDPGDLVATFTDPATALPDFLDQEVAVQKMNLVGMDSILAHGESHIIKSADVALGHRSVF